MHNKPNDSKLALSSRSIVFLAWFLVVDDEEYFGFYSFDFFKMLPDR